MQTNRITPAHVRKNQLRRLAALKPIHGWPCNTLGNHDSPRMKNQFGDGEHDDALARLHVAMLLTLKGTPFFYYGEEIGMTDLYLNNIDQFRDLMAIWQYKAEVNLLQTSPDLAIRQVALMTRDKNRTPMQWENSPNAGFCPPHIDPWLPVNPNYMLGVNVDEQDPNPNSQLNYYRLLLYWRKALPALQQGDFTLLSPRSKNILAYLRTTAQQTILVVLNFDHQAHHFRWKKSLRQENKLLRILFRTYPTDEEFANETIVLGPYEALFTEVEI
jgi:alpha-glucosidase